MKELYLIKVIDPRCKDKNRVNYLLRGRNGRLFTVFEPIPRDVFYENHGIALGVAHKLDRHKTYRPHLRSHDCFRYDLFRIKLPETEDLNIFV